MPFLENILRLLPKNYRNKIENSNERSKDALKNIAISLLVKVANIFSSLLIVPLTINYVNPTQYGIWLSLSTIIGWVTFFDLGLGNGFRNKFTEAKAKGDTNLAVQYLSTTYFAITSIVILVYVGILIANSYVDWASVLGVEQTYREELHKIFAIICGFMCLNMIANIFGTMLTADQKPGIAAAIQGLGQYIALLIIFILTKVTTGSLTNLAIYYSGAPCITMLLVSVIFFLFTKYKEYRPKISQIRLPLIKNILNLGFQFFAIYLCLIIVFQLVNIVLSRELGPLSVTEYNVANRYFNILYMVINIIVTPFWSAFTDAYTKKDYMWMKNTLRKLEQLFAVCFVVGIVMIFISPVIYGIWIGTSVLIHISLTTCVAFLTIIRSLASIYLYLINGIGTVRLQLITYIIFAIIAWPSMLYSVRLFGINGIVIVPSIVYIAQIIVSKIQLKKHIEGTAAGIWLK